MNLDKLVKLSKDAEIDNKSIQLNINIFPYMLEPLIGKIKIDIADEQANQFTDSEKWLELDYELKSHFSAAIMLALKEKLKEVK